MQNAGQYVPGAASAHPPQQFAPSEPSPNGGSTTSSLRQFRKRDVDKSQLEQPQKQESHVARVAPHNHYPPVSNELYRYPSHHQFTDYSPQVKYSEIADTAQANQISTSVIQKPKTKEYMEMCNVQQQHLNSQSQYSPENGQYIHRDPTQGYPTGFKPETHYLPKDQHQYQQLAHHPSQPKFNTMMNQSLRKYNSGPHDNPFLNKLSKIHPSMARNIISDHHLQDPQPSYSPLDQRSMYGQQNHRYYSGSIHQPNPYAPNPSYTVNGPHHYANYPPPSCGYPRTPSINPRYNHMERSISPGRRGGYPENLHMNQIPYPNMPQRMPSGGNYPAQFSAGPEYAQHYQHRRMGQECYPQQCRPQYIQNHHQMPAQELQEMPESRISPSDSLKKFIENWAADEEPSAEVNPMENNLTLRDNIKMRDDAPPGTLYMINATDVQYFESNGIPIVASDNGGIHLTPENYQYLIKNGLVDNSGMLRIIETNKEISIDPSGNHERVVNLQIMEPPKSDCMLATKNVRTNSCSLATNIIPSKTEDDGRRVVIHQDTLISSGSCAIAQKPSCQLSSLNDITVEGSIGKELVDKNCSPINLDQLEHNLGFNETDETETENIKNLISTDNTDDHKNIPNSNSKLDSEDDRSPDDNNSKSPGLKSMPIIDLFGVNQTNENKDEMPKINNKIEENVTVNDDLEGKKSAASNLLDNHEINCQISTEQDQPMVDQNDNDRLTTDDSSNLKADENLGSDVNSKVLTSTVIVSPDIKKPDFSDNEISRENSKASECLRVSGQTDAENIESLKSPTIPSVSAQETAKPECEKTDSITDSLELNSNVTITSTETSSRTKRAFSVDNIIHHIGNNVKRASRDFDLIPELGTLIFIEKEIEFSSIEQITQTSYFARNEKQNKTIEMDLSVNNGNPTTSGQDINSSVEKSVEHFAVINSKCFETEEMDISTTEDSNSFTQSITQKPRTEGTESRKLENQSEITSIESNLDPVAQNHDMQYRNVIRVEDPSVLLQIAGEMIEISINVVNGKKVITVVPLSETTIVDYNDNYEVSANVPTDQSDNLENGEEDSLETEVVNERSCKVIDQPTNKTNSDQSSTSSSTTTEESSVILPSENDSADKEKVKDSVSITSDPFPEIVFKEQQEEISSESNIPEDSNRIAKDEILEIVVSEGTISNSNEDAIDEPNMDSTTVSKLDLWEAETAESPDKDVISELCESQVDADLEENIEQLNESITETFETPISMTDSKATELELSLDDLEIPQNIDAIAVKCQGTDENKNTNGTSEEVENNPCNLQKTILNDDDALISTITTSEKLDKDSDSASNSIEIMEESAVEIVDNIQNDLSDADDIEPLEYELEDDVFLPEDPSHEIIVSDPLEGVGLIEEIDKTSDICDIPLEPVTTSEKNCLSSTYDNQISDHNCSKEMDNKEEIDSVILSSNDNEENVKDFNVKYVDQMPCTKEHYNHNKELIIKLSKPEVQILSPTSTNIEDHIAYSQENVYLEPRKKIKCDNDVSESSISPVTTKAAKKLYESDLQIPAVTTSGDVSPKSHKKSEKYQHDTVSSSKKERRSKELVRNRKAMLKRSKRINDKIKTKNEKREMLRLLTEKRRQRQKNKEENFISNNNVQNHFNGDDKIISNMVTKVVDVKSESQKSSTENDDEYVDFKELLKARKLKKLKKMQLLNERKKVNIDPENENIIHVQHALDPKKSVKVDALIAPDCQGQPKNSNVPKKCCIGCNTSTKKNIEKDQQFTEKSKSENREREDKTYPVEFVEVKSSSMASSPSSETQTKSSYTDLVQTPIHSNTLKTSVTVENMSHISQKNIFEAKIEEISSRKRLSFCDDITSSSTSLQEFPKSSNNVKTYSSMKDPRKNSKSNSVQIMVPSVSELMEENNGPVSKRKISLADYVNRKRKTSEVQNTSEKKMKLDDLSVKKSSTEKYPSSDEPRFSKTLKDVKTSFVIHSSDWEDSRSPLPTDVQSNEDCLIRDFSGLNENKSKRPVIDINELKTLEPLENLKDKKLQEYKDKVDSQLSSLNIQIPKIKSQHSKSKSSDVEYPNVSPDSNRLIKRFLSNEKITPGEMEKIKQIISYKRLINNQKNMRSPSKTPSSTGSAYIPSSTCSIYEPTCLDAKSPAAARISDGDVKSDSAYEIKSIKTIESESKEMRLHLKKVNAKRKSNSECESENSSSINANKNDPGCKKDVDYSVINRLGKDGLPKIIFKRNRQCKVSADYQPVVELERIDHNLEKVQKEFNVKVTQLM